MKAVTSRINYFTPIDDKGPVTGNFYLDQCGNIVKIPYNVKLEQVNLPMAVSFDLFHTDDVCTMHISEMEEMVSKLQSNLQNIDDPIKKAKYEGYIEALNYIISFNSYIDPWSDFIADMESEFYNGLD